MTWGGVGGLLSMPVRASDSPSSVVTGQLPPCHNGRSGGLRIRAGPMTEAILVPLAKFGARLLVPCFT
jgi:hypothetical protein